MIRDYEEITRLLKAARVEKGLTNHAISKKIGCDPATYSKRENNPQLITVGFIEEIAKALDISSTRVRKIFFTN